MNNTMYVVTPYPNILYALDLTKPDAPAKWKYEPKPVAAAQGVACCDVVNRGAAYEVMALIPAGRKEVIDLARRPLGSAAAGVT